MRKPISKHGLRRAFDKAIDEGDIECHRPVNSVIDRLWHEMERENYNGGKKKTTSRETVRIPAIDTAETD